MSTPCPKCKNIWGLRHFFDIQVKDGKVYDLRYQGCEACGYETEGTLKYLGLESEVWPDPDEPDPDEPDPNPYHEVGMRSSDFSPWEDLQSDLYFFPCTDALPNATSKEA